MDRFWQDAVSVFDIACSAPAGAEAGQLNILIGGDGALHLISGEGWQPEALRSHFGAHTVYQVTRTPAGVKVAGHSTDRDCLLHSTSPASFAYDLGAGLPFYSLSPVAPGKLIP
jgi:hypothetical protein